MGGLCCSWVVQTLFVQHQNKDGPLQLLILEKWVWTLLIQLKAFFRSTGCGDDRQCWWWRHDQVAQTDQISIFVQDIQIGLLRKWATRHGGMITSLTWIMSTETTKVPKQKHSCHILSAVFFCLFSSSCTFFRVFVETRRCSKVLNPDFDYVNQKVNSCLRVQMCHGAMQQWSNFAQTVKTSARVIWVNLWMWHQQQEGRWKGSIQWGAQIRQLRVPQLHHEELEFCHWFHCATNCKPIIFQLMAWVLENGCHLHHIWQTGSKVAVPNAHKMTWLKQRRCCLPKKTWQSLQFLQKCNQGTNHVGFPQDSGFPCAVFPS